MDDKWRKEAIGKRIRAVRESLNMSQKDLYGKTKIKDSMISSFERGKRGPSTANLAKIAHALNITMDELYFGDECNRIIENAPNYGIKIVNCIYELKKAGIIGEAYVGNIPKDKFSAVISLWKEAYPIQRLLKSLNEFGQNIDTYSDPDVFLEQIKQSVANEINNKRSS